MSVSKPFVFALVCDAVGAETAREKLGVNATGRPFNSIEAIERSDDGRTNPLVNSGAIATTSLAPGTDQTQKWKFLHAGLSSFAGRQLAVDEGVYSSASDTNYRNRAIASVLQTRHAIYSDPAEATDLYTKQCSLSVSAKDLAIMAVAGEPRSRRSRTAA